MIFANRGDGTEYYGLSELIFDPTQPLQNTLDLINSHYDILVDMNTKEVCVKNSIVDFWKLWKEVGADYTKAVPLT